MSGQDLAGAFEGEFGGGVSPAGRPRLPVRLMVSLLYLKHSFNLSDEELVQRWAENVQWQFFSGMGYYEPRLVRAGSVCSTMGLRAACHNIGNGAACAHVVGTRERELNFAGPTE